MILSQKKIAFILKGYPRVSETFIAQEIYLLEQKGYDVEIFSMRKARESERQPIVSKIKAPIVYIPEYIHKEPFKIFFGNFVTFLKKPIRYLYLLSVALLKTCQYLKKDPIKRFLQACWLISNQGLDKRKLHLHSHFIHTPTEMTRYISQFTGLKYSISAHAKDIYTIPVKEVIDRIDHSEFLTTCTRFNYEFLLQQKLQDKSKVHLSYHGIDTETFLPSKRDCLENKSPYLISSVGRLVEKKGYNIIFQALKILNDRDISFHYDIFGQGDLKAKLLKSRNDLGLTNYIKFHYTATHPQIIERFKQKGIFLCGSQITSSGDRDGIPNTIAEAMSMELPVIATKVSGIPELIKHKDSGFLIEPKDPVAMADAIQYLIDNPSVTQRMARNGRQRVQEFFDASSCIQHIDKLLGSCLS